MNKVKYVVIIVVALFGLMQAVLSNYSEYVYSDIHLDVDDELINAGAFRIKGEVFGEELDKYHGNYSEQINYYLKFLSRIRLREDVTGMVSESSRDLVREYTEEIFSGDNIWESSNLVAVFSSGNKVVGFLEHKLKKSDYKPLRFFTVSGHGEEKRIELSDDMDFIKHEALNAGYFSKDTKSDISFIGDYRKLYFELASYLCGDRIQLDGSAVILNPVCFNRDSMDDDTIDIIEDGSMSIEYLFHEGSISDKSKSRAFQWIKKMNVEPREVTTLQIFGQEMSLINFFKVGDDCTIYEFKLGDNDQIRRVYNCFGKVVNLMSKSSFNHLIDSGLY